MPSTLAIRRRVVRLKLAWQRLDWLETAFREVVRSALGGSALRRKARVLHRPCALIFFIGSLPSTLCTRGASAARRCQSRLDRDLVKRSVIRRGLRASYRVGLGVAVSGTPGDDRSEPCTSGRYGRGSRNAASVAAQSAHVSTPPQFI